MTPVLHLMVNNTCTNNCLLCCNKQYDIENLAVVTVKELQSIDTICFTGGAPMLNLQSLALFSTGLERTYPNINRIYIYMNGAELSSVYNQNEVSLKIFKNFPLNSHIHFGLTMSPKCEKDWEIIRLISHSLEYYTSNRLYCFSDTDVAKAKEIFPNGNVEIIKREWQVHFIPAPNTIFRRLPIWIV